MFSIRYNFLREICNHPVVKAIEYDPNRSSRIALLKYEDGEFRYIIAPDKIKVGDEIVAGPDAEYKDGRKVKFKNRVDINTIKAFRLIVKNDLKNLTKVSVDSKVNNQMSVIVKDVLEWVLR